MAIYGYSRVSSVKQATDGTSIDDQAGKLAGFAQIKGGKLDTIYSDPATSGSIPVSERPEGAKMMARLQRGDSIVATKLDRMFRSSRDCLNTIEELRSRGVSLYLLDLGLDDVCGNGFSRMVMTILSAVAEMEREQSRERTLSSKAYRREHGLHNGGHVEFGFLVGPDKVLLKDAAQQETIARVRALRDNGAKLREIQEAMISQGRGKLSLSLLHRLTAE